MAEQIAKRLKLVLVGDATVGKTSLLIRYTRNEFPDIYNPTVFDHFYVDLDSSIGKIRLDLFDTAGNEGYEELRELSYKGADILLLCFAVDNVNSMFHVKEKWYQEIRKCRPNATIILVGTKSDMRKKGLGKVSRPQIESLQKRLKLKYIECSSIVGENVKEVFALGMEEAVLKEINASNSSDDSLLDKIKKICCC